jgi:hypothetical protein
VFIVVAGFFARLSSPEKLRNESTAEVSPPPPPKEPPPTAIYEHTPSSIIAELELRGDRAAHLADAAQQKLKRNHELCEAGIRLRRAIDDLLSFAEKMERCPVPPSGGEVTWWNQAFLPLQRAIEGVRAEVASSAFSSDDHPELIGMLLDGASDAVYSRGFDCLLEPIIVRDGKAFLHHEVSEGSGSTEVEMVAYTRRIYVPCLVVGTVVSAVVTAATGNSLVGIGLVGTLFAVVRGKVENHCVSKWYREFGEMKVGAFLADLPDQCAMLSCVRGALQDLLEHD